jgi:hypothetical protein
MSIAAVNMTWIGNAQTETGEIVAPRNASGKRVLEGYGTATLDGSLTTFDVNFIDGTKVLPFTPSTVTCTVAGGDQQASAYIGANVSSFTTAKAVIVTSGAGTNTKTIKLHIRIVE